MVSGLVTSPCDQLRIFSGDARLIRMASKSATGFAISNGLDRNMFLRFPVDLTRPPAALDYSSQFPVLSSQRTKTNRIELCRIAALRANATAANCSKLFFQIPGAFPGSEFSARSRPLRTEN